MVKRRGILTTLKALSTCLVLSSMAQAQELGVQLYSLRHQMAESVPDSMAQLSEWGIHAVEGGGNLYGHSVSDFKAILDKNHIQIVSVDTNYEEVRDNPIAIAYKAQFYGARFATFYWIPHNGEFTIEHAKEAVDIMNTAGALLNENGITLQYHPHGYEFGAYEDGTILDYMLENVENAKFQMDVFWVKHGGQDPVAMLNKYPGKFTSLHIKDRAHGTQNTLDGKADPETNVVLGQGDIGIPEVLATARQHGLAYYFIEDESSRVLEQIPASMKFFMELNGQNIPN